MSAAPLFSFDAFALQRFGGVTRYCIELHRELRRRGVPSVIHAPLYVTEGLAGLPGVVGLPVPHAWRDHLAARRISKVLGRATEPMALRLAGGGVQRVRQCSYFARPRPTHRVPTVLMVHDMIHERFPTSFPASDEIAVWKRAWCVESSVVFANSETTRQDLLEAYELPPEKVHVTPLGVAKVPADPATEEALATRPPFLLYVGARRGYKNFDGFIRSFARSRSHGEGMTVVAFGGGAPAPEDLRVIDDAGVRDVVRFSGGDDRVLAAHYAGASALIYPSEYEGFGLPPLEAMTQGCPVLTSNAPAVAEVCDDAAMYFDLHEPDSFRDAIDEIASDDGRRRELQRCGFQRAARYSWAACADSALRGYEVAIDHWRAERRRATR